MRFFESMGNARLVSLVAAAALALAACPDPQGEFDAFGERINQIEDDGEGGTGGGEGGAPACLPQAAGEADGQYLFALSAADLNAEKAFALDADVVTTDAGDGALSLTLTLQPLSKTDQSTPVGDPLVFEDLPVNADGTFEWDFGTVTLIEEANPISEGNYVEATLVLTGSLCGGDRADFICGNVTGTVLHPLEGFPLTESKFTMQRYEGSDLPEPVINCAKDPAVYR